MLVWQQVLVNPESLYVMIEAPAQHNLHAAVLQLFVAEVSVLARLKLHAMVHVEILKIN